ncbi:hypothetical protein ACFQZS_01785 [Mucilaginibacter calamicampi]|uniref:Uncharacterized protein n=1 Tax=Mucilaginibacter calamicampi TaxID=1302352 RepID=A0ABW2YR40_9SPHI
MVAKTLIFLLLLCTVITSRADTIDYWHVRYNGKLIREYNIHEYEKIIHIKALTLKASDSISVNYSNDRPCSNCETGLILLDDRKIKHSIVKGNGMFKPLTFSLKDAQNIGGKSFDIYYSDRYKTDLYLFTIYIE